MTAEEKVLDTVRRFLDGFGIVVEKKMFGGVGFMLDGKLVAGVSKRGLLLRVGADRSETTLTFPHTRPMKMRGRLLRDYIYIDPPGCTAKALDACLALATAFVGALPPKSTRKKKRATSRPVRSAVRR